MKRLRTGSKWHWLAITMVLFGAVIHAQASGVDASVRFSPDDFSAHASAEGDRVFVEGCRLRTEVAGEPDLPARLYRLVIPADMAATDLNVTRAEYQTLKALGGRFQIPPALPPMPLDGSFAPNPAPPNQAIYGQDAPYPATPVEIVSEGFAFGYHVVTLRIHPVRYYPLSGRLELLTHLDFSIDGPPTTANRVFAQRRSGAGAATVHKTMASLIDNDEALQSYAPPSRIEPYDGVDGGRPMTVSLPSLQGLPVDYVIITSPELEDSFVPLAEWKQAKGLNTAIVTIPEIVANYPGVDTQECIRNFIIEAIPLWGTTWVLLGGDVNHVPDRKGFYDGDSHTWGPTDLYYATVEGNWNADGDAVFGESGDDIDHEADCFVGRAPVENVYEADLFVDKVLNYEQSPTPNFMQDILLMGATYDCDGSWNWGQGYNEDVADFMTPHLADPDSIYRMYNFQDGTFGGDEFHGDVLLTSWRANIELNAGYHIVSHLDHSSPHSLGTGQRHCGGGSFVSADACALTNGARQGIFVSTSCSPNAFDYDAISEDLMNNANGGVVAFIGNSRTGYVSQHPQHTTFFSSLFTDGLTHIGDAFNHARTASTDTKYRRLYNLLGDPEMRIWLADPEPLSVQHPSSVSVGRQAVSITVQDTSVVPPVPVEGARVCLYKPDEAFVAKSTGSNGSVLLILTCDTPGEIRLTVTAEGYLPYQVVVPVTPAANMPHLRVADFQIDDDESGASDGNGDGVADVGETLELMLQITNSGTAEVLNVGGTLRTSTAGVTIVDGSFNTGGVAPGETVQAGPFIIEIDSACPAETLAMFSVKMMGLPYTLKFADDFWFFVHAPSLGINGAFIDDDNVGQSQGNGDGVPQAGETIEVFMELANRGHGGARAVSAVATANSQWLNVIDDASAFGDIDSMRAAEALDPIVVEILSGYGGRETLTLVVSDEYQPCATFIVDLEAPPAPSGLEFQASEDWIEITWDGLDPNEVMGYHVYRAFDPNAVFQRQDILVQVGSSLYRDDIHIMPPFPDYYYYRVTSVDYSGNESAPSEILQTWLTHRQQNGWPVVLPCLGGGVAVADVDKDGDMEIFVGSLDGKVYAFHHDGSELEFDGDPDTLNGFAQVDGSGGIWAAPSIGDIDGDGWLDVVVTARTSANKIYAWHVCDANGDHQADPVPNWPVSLPDGGKSLSSPALGDIDGDGVLEVVFTVQSGKVHVIDGLTGIEEAGWPHEVADWTYSTPALGDVASRLGQAKKSLEVVVGDHSGRIYVWYSDGTPVSGWPVYKGGQFSSSPALGDIDGDRRLEIVVNSDIDGTTNDFIYALEADGTDVAGWVGGVSYTSTGGGKQPSPALANVTGDARPEVFVTTLDGIAGWSPDGSPLAGWPVELTELKGEASSPVVADIDSDRAFEILTGFGDQRFHALEVDGTTVEHWPAPVHEEMVRDATIVDLDNDGDLEVIICAGHVIYVWDCPDGNSIEWGTFHGNVRRTGLYAPRSLVPRPFR